MGEYLLSLRPVNTRIHGIVPWLVLLVLLRPDPGQRNKTFTK